MCIMCLWCDVVWYMVLYDSVWIKTAKVLQCKRTRENREGRGCKRLGDVKKDKIRSVN